MIRTQKIIAPLASLKAQERYILQATVEEYYVPEELLDSAISALRHEQDTAIVRELKEQLEKITLPVGLSPRQLVYEYQPWVKLRALSANYLNSFCC